VINKTTLIVTAVGAAVLGAATMYALPGMAPRGEYTFLRGSGGEFGIYRANKATGRVDRCWNECNEMTMHVEPPKPAPKPVK
jgi:hypothetical protein